MVFPNVGSRMFNGRLVCLFVYRLSVYSLIFAIMTFIGIIISLEVIFLYKNSKVLSVPIVP